MIRFFINAEQCANHNPQTAKFWEVPCWSWGGNCCSHL